MGALFGDPQAVTAIGDTVNVAARIEQANKQAGTRLLVSAEALADVTDVVEVGRTVCCSLTGKTGEHTLYEVVGLAAANPEPEGTPR